VRGSGSLDGDCEIRPVIGIERIFKSGNKDGSIGLIASILGGVKAKKLNTFASDRKEGLTIRAEGFFKVEYR
jgi:hypothetical protein